MPSITVHIPSNILETIYAGAKELYPRESFLLLRGKKSKSTIQITDLVLAPFAVHGEGEFTSTLHVFRGLFFDGNCAFTSFRNISPNHVGLNYFFGRVLVIVRLSYEGKTCIAARLQWWQTAVEITAP